MKYKGVFFDFDYTLGDATDAIFAGFTHGMTTLGHPAPQREAVRRTVGMLLEDGYTTLSGDESGEGRGQFRTLFSAVARPMQAQGVPLCPGAKELILALYAAGIETSVVSTKHTPTLTAILGQHGLDRLFSDIIGGDLVDKPKPDPEGVNTALGRLGLAAGEILYCGDTVIDAETAKNVGCDFCAVLNGTTEALAFEAWPCVHIAPDLIELKSWLGI